MLLVSFGALIFLVFFALIQDRIVEAKAEELSRDLKEVADGLTSEINLAIRFGEGYNRTIFLPYTIKGINYNISIANDRDLVVQSNNIKQLFFFNRDIKGNFTYGYNNLTVFAGTVYVNVPYSDLLGVQIDGDIDDWKTLFISGEAQLLTDERYDSYSKNENINNPHDLRQALIWNDNENLYVFIELYQNSMNDFNSGINTDNWDLLILFDNDLNSNTGYFSDNYSMLISSIGADFMVIDRILRIDSQNMFLPGNTSDMLPMKYDGTGEDWAWNPSGNPRGSYAVIDDYSIEYSIPLASNKLNVGPGDSIGFSIISKTNWPPLDKGISDFIPGSYDDYSGGVYTLK